MIIKQTNENFNIMEQIEGKNNKKGQNSNLKLTITAFEKFSEQINLEFKKEQTELYRSC